MQGADRINEELEVGFDQTFERSWLRAEQVGRIVMVLFVAAGIAGLLGRGPYSHQTVTIADRTLAVDFEPVARSQTGTQVTFHLRNDTDRPTMNLFIGTGIVEPMGLQRILPQPLDTQAVQGGLLLKVTVPPGTRDAAVRVMLQPVGIGPKDLVARLDGHPALHWTQFVVP
jgi:hypothetical protein